jgi:hypothetical protein
MTDTKNEVRKSGTLLISRERQLIFDIIVVVLYLGFSIYLIYSFHAENTNKDLAYSLLVGLSGTTIGWLIGILATPFSSEEQEVWSVEYSDTRFLIWIPIE